LEV
jgi:carboxyl-terminal processing protease